MNNLAYENKEETESCCVQTEEPRRLVKQRLAAVGLIIWAVILPLLCDGDCTGSLLCFSFGIVLLQEKSKVM